MSIWTVKTDLTGRRQCKRCKRMFTPHAEGQEYGSTCARKVAAEAFLAGESQAAQDREHELDRFGAD